MTASVLAQTYENPHGPYEAFPVGCAACHVAHAALGPKLVPKADITALCLTCHDGTASVFNVVYVPETDIYGTGVTREVYGFGFGTTAGAVYFHPVKNTGNPAVDEVIECVHCHNPHGDMSIPNQVYPRLLNSSDGTARYYQGPNYCLACHGATDHNFTGDTDTYWEDTLGDHSNSDAAHYITAEGNPLLPPSGTKVTCVGCHYKHAAPNKRLLKLKEENLCWDCHSLTGWDMVHPVTNFSKTGSVHNVDEAGGSKLECSSCHGPHTINTVTNVGCTQCHYPYPTDYNAYKLEGEYSVLADPDNTKKKFAGAEGTGLGGLSNTVGDLSDFCTECHDGAPPTAVANVYEFVPYTIIFPQTNFTTNSGGWDKGNYKTSAHGTASPKITCGDCHESHGSDYRALQRYAEDDETTDGECLRCHKSDGGAPDIKSDLLKSSRHPTLTVSGEHSNTEDYTDISVRHAECADCHDVHVATKADAIKGVSGVSIDYSGSVWDNWPPAQDKFTFKRPLDHQYELCFKCHSCFSYGSSPPNGYTDQAKEFNPNNDSYHAVWGESKMQQTFTYDGQTYYYGKFVAPWTATSWVYCTDCHGSDSGTAPEGPHGSTYQYILKGPWGTDTGASDTGDHLCFNCHDYEFYAGNDDESPTVRSKFSGSKSSSKYNYHAKHAKKGTRCVNCHGSIPHGYFNRGILVEKTDPAPYNTGSALKIQNWADPGDWDCKDCHGCDKNW